MNEKVKAHMAPLPFAVFDEFGQGCEDRVADHYRAIALHAEQAGPPRKWADAVQLFADELGLPFLEAKSFLDEVFPQWMADKEAAGFVTLRRDDLIEGDSYGVDGSDFYRCRICHAESGAGMLNNGIKHEHDCPLAARPSEPPNAPVDPVGEREAFEAWAKTQKFWTLHRDEHGDYSSQSVYGGWIAWQGCAARSTKGSK